MNPLAVCVARDLPRQAEEARWLVEELWSAEAVGIVGGEPKCCKSFLALDMAVSVASGAACLGRFRVNQTGRVLLFAAEDSTHIVRERLEAIALRRGVNFASLDIYVITTPVVRLDREADRHALQETVTRYHPRLLILDPFVRLHRIDENAAAEVAPLLAYLRELQRNFQTAVLLVHHARKGAANARAGQALRGSSELHAWGDSNLYMRRRAEVLELTVEHRAAASCPPLPLELTVKEHSVALEIPETQPVDAQKSTSAGPEHRVQQVLAAATGAVALQELRRACQMRTTTLCSTLAAMTRQGRVIKKDNGYKLTGT
jgi:hypothetical protein